MMKKQNRTYTDSILMRLCKNKARQKGYYSDEPQYKAYCTKLYNATKEGRGLSGLAGDASNIDTAERLTKIFKNIGFPYRVEAEGKFLNFYDLNEDAEEPLLFDDEAEDVFYDQFGKVVNFKILISQFYDRDDKVKQYVEKSLSQKSRAKQSVVEPSEPEAEEKLVEVKPVKKPKPAKRKAEKVVEPTEPEKTGARGVIARLKEEVYSLVFNRDMIGREPDDADAIQRAKKFADLHIAEIEEAQKGYSEEQLIRDWRWDVKAQKNAYDRALEEAAERAKSQQLKPDRQSKFNGKLGGLKYEVLTAEEYRKELKSSKHTSSSEQESERLPRVSSIENLPGYKLLNQFGLPSFSYTSDGQKKYAKWAIRVEDLGILVISSGAEVRDDEVDYRGIMLRDMTHWWVFLLLDPQQESITEQQCDHASHFFGDSFFANAGVSIPLKGCVKPTANTETSIERIDPNYSVDAVESGTFSDKEGNVYDWSLVDFDEASRLMKLYGLRYQEKVAEVYEGYIDEINKLNDFFNADPVRQKFNLFYPIVVRKNNGVPSQFVFGYNDPQHDFTKESKGKPSLYLHSYIWQNITVKPLWTNYGNEYAMLQCDTAKALIKHLGLKMKLVTPCNQRKKSVKGVSDCCNDADMSDDMQSLEQIVQELTQKHDIELDAYEYKDHIIISRIVVPKSKRNEGIGTEVIEAIIEYADEQGKDVFVTPTGDFGGSTSRLAKFYKRFGFVPNKGRYRDFRTRESMIYKAEGMNDDMSRHQAPYRDEEGFFQPAYDVSQMFPGIYTSSFSKALREYGTGSDSDPESLQIIRNIHNNPEAKVKIYRAVEKGLRDNINDLKKDRDYIKRNGSVPPWSDIPPGNTDEYSMFVDSQIENLGAVDSAAITPTINPKDWVTISRQYAVDHGECCVPGDYTILSKTVKAKDLYTEGNSIHEWGYDPSQESSLGGDSFTPPKDVQEEAERGLEWRREYGRGGTEVGVARARDLSNGRSVSYDTVKRMKAFFDRHEVDKQAEGFRVGEEGYPSAGRIAWALWGGDAGYRWAKSIVGKSNDTQGLGATMFADQLEGKTTNVQEKEEPKEVAPLTTQEIVNMEPPQTLPLKGELRDFLSSLLAKFNMLIWGGAGSGKSSFVLRLANELAETNTGRVLYFMTEEKVSSGRLKARMDLMKAYSDNVNFDDHGTFDRLTALVNTGMYRYVIVDSINMINVEQTKIVELMQTFPEVSWIFIAQATKGKNAYAGIQSLAHAVDTEIATSNDKGTAVAELKKHRDGALKTHTIFGNTGMRDPQWQAQW